MQMLQKDKLLMKVILVFLIGIILWLQYRLWFADDGIIRSFHLKQEIKLREEDNRRLEQQNAVLVSEIDSLKRGGIAIETRARADLGMVKKGEVFYQVIK